MILSGLGFNGVDSFSMILSELAFKGKSSSSTSILKTFLSSTSTKLLFVVVVDVVSGGGGVAVVVGIGLKPLWDERMCLSRLSSWWKAEKNGKIAD